MVLMLLDMITPLQGMQAIQVDATGRTLGCGGKPDRHACLKVDFIQNQPIKAMEKICIRPDE
ncbi:hypothetical protein JCM14635_06320 [Megalodesulfovibrio paquesii]